VKISLNHQILQQILLFLLSSILVTACHPIQAEEIGKSGEKASNKVSNSDDSGKLSDQGRLRTYYLYTPKSYNPSRPMPLVIVFHGSAGSGHSMASMTRFNDLAEKKGFVAVYPDGINHNWHVRQGSSASGIDDVSFVKALIAHLQQVRNIDSQRIYATGFSKGGILTQTLACNLSDQIAAFASVAGALPVPVKSSCQPENPISMMMINGTGDRSVHYEGDPPDKRGALVSIPNTVEHWRQHDSCPATAKVRQFPPTNSPDSSGDSFVSKFKVKVSHYSGCRNSSEVMLAAVVNGGHFWPGGASQDPQLNQVNRYLSFNSSDQIWDFFQHHKLPEKGR
jgi:polyhydroxybutyrate depolymerase